jgi:hypothetical protein
VTLIADLPKLGLTPALAVEGVHELLDAIAPFSDVADRDHASLVRECARARARLQALELKLVAAADKARVPTDSGAASTAAWHASVTNTEPAESARQTKLATALDEEALAGTAGALGHGEVSAAHAVVIAAAIKALPEGLAPDEVAKVEADLLAKARVMNPKALRKAARRALEALARERAVVDAHEDTQIREEEERARAKTRLTLHDNGDGTVTLHATVPTLAAAVLKKVLDQMTSPRRGRLGATEAQAGGPGTANPTSPVYNWARRRGEVFVSLLERLPTDHLHSKVAATVVVNLDHDTLRDGLAAAGLDTGDVISAAEARRLACSAGLVPAVLGGASQPLDLGRTQRFFTEAQRVAGALVHETCAADGCDMPYAWAEAHHRQPWSAGGRTDQRELVPLCSFHHQRIHDPTYHHHYRADGSIAFTRRT